VRLGATKLTRYRRRSLVELFSEKFRLSVRCKFQPRCWPACRRCRVINRNGAWRANNANHARRSGIIFFILQAKSAEYIAGIGYLRRASAARKQAKHVNVPIFHLTHCRSKLSRILTDTSNSS
jgi:hypothetical protein